MSIPRSSSGEPSARHLSSRCSIGFDGCSVGGGVPANGSALRGRSSNESNGGSAMLRRTTMQNFSTSLCERLRPEYQRGALIPPYWPSGLTADASSSWSSERWSAPSRLRYY